MRLSSKPIAFKLEAYFVFYEFRDSSYVLNGDKKSPAPQKGVGLCYDIAACVRCCFYMCCHFVEGGLLEQAEDFVYYLVDIRGVVEFFQLFVEFVFHLFTDLVGQFVNSLVGLVFEL